MQELWVYRTQPTSTGTVGLQDTANINRNCGSTGHSQHQQELWVYRTQPTSTGTVGLQDTANINRNCGSTGQPTSTGTVGLQDTANINRNCGSTGTLSDLVLDHNYHTGTVCLMLVTDFVLGHCQHKQKQWVYKHFTDCALGQSLHLQTADVVIWTCWPCVRT